MQLRYECRVLNDIYKEDLLVDIVYYKCVPRMFALFQRLCEPSKLTCAIYQGRIHSNWSVRFSLLRFHMPILIPNLH